MSKEKKEFTSKIKFYHMLLLGCVLTTLLILNSNSVNEKRAKDKLNKEKSILFDKIISERLLEEGETDKSNKSSIDEVCKRGSEKLNNYYKTGNLEEIDLKKGNIECEDKDKEYMQVIIKLLKSKLGGGSDKEEEKEGEKEKEEENAPEGTRRNLEDEEDNNKEEGEISKDDIITYGKHILPALVFLVVAILCIPGWLLCCFCCCCNCCCCCCCKKPCCKIPCFIITYVLYALVVAVCFYGLSQSNHIFVGIADTECSILRFLDEILEGESKETLPKWAGINGIKGILNGLSSEVNSMGSDTANELNSEYATINDEENGTKASFLKKLKDHGDYLNNNNQYRTTYIKEYLNGENSYVEGKYVLDLIKKFGIYDEDEEVGYPDDSYINAWVTEYKLVSEMADEQMDTAKTGFNEILGDKLGEVDSALGEGINAMDGIDSSIGDIKGSISDMIIDNSETIDDYGKLGIKVVFGVLALINVAIAVFMLLLCFCSGKCCTKCCCCRYICKLFTHLLWNILALLMIIVFLVGSLFTLIGKVGSDVMNVISYLVSEDNLGKDKDTILLGGAKDYLQTCILGDGKLEDKLGFDLSSINSLNDIHDAQDNISYAKTLFEEKKDMVVYKNISGELEQRRALSSSIFTLLPVDDNHNQDFLNFAVLLEYINADSTALEKKEKWTPTCNSNNECSSTSSSDGSGDIDTDADANGNKCFQPNSCLPSDRYWIRTREDNDETKVKAAIISDMKDIVENAYKTHRESEYLYFNEILTDLKNSYETFLNSYVDALDKFNKTISRINDKIDKYTGKNGGVFSFINCNFIGTNIKIVLKYLKEVLGGDIYTIGICLILVGCSLSLSISFTILLIIVINADIDDKKKNSNKLVPFK